MPLSATDPRVNHNPVGGVPLPPTWAAGPMGPPGPPGPIGPQGYPGNNGQEGIAGDMGPAGATGAQGPVGPAGPTGPQGLTGPGGVQGPAGPIGPIGPAGGGIQYLGQVATIAALPSSAHIGDAWSVASNNHLYIWDGGVWVDNGPFQGPVGPMGPAGTTGPQGPQGVKGDVGAMGPQGVQGPIGATGPQGSTGPQGATGTTGAQGPAGQGVPAGGTANQVLTKVDATNYNTIWTTPPVGFTQAQADLRYLQLSGGTLAGPGNLAVGGTLTVGGNIVGANIAANGYLSASDGSNGIVQSGTGSLYVRGANGTVVMDGAAGLSITVGSLNVGGIATAAGVTSVSVGFLSNANGVGITFIDANSRIFSASRTTYFDEYAGGWFWRDTNRGAAASMSLGGGGRLTISEHLYITGGRIYSPSFGLLVIHAPAVYVRDVADSAWAPVICGTLTINASGNQLASVGGWAAVGDSTNHGMSFYSAGGAGGPTGWQTISSERFKSDVGSITNALDIVLNPALHGIHYMMLPPRARDAEGKSVQPPSFAAYGFLAEAWANAVPDVVSYDGQQVSAMDYGQVNAILFEAFKQYVERTDARIASLEGGVA